MRLASLLDKIITCSFYLLLFLIPLIFSPLNYELFEYPKMTLVYILTIFISISWLGKIILKKEIRIKKTPLDVPILLYLISSVLSTISSIHPYTSTWGYYSRSHGGLISTICYILLYYSFTSNFNQKKAKKGLRILLTSASLIAIYAILEKLGIDKNYWVQDVQNRVFSTLGQPNWLGAFLTSLIFFPLAFYFHSQEKKYLLFYLVFFLPLIFTNSKSAILAFWLCFPLFIGLNLLLNKTKKNKDKGKVLKPSLILISLTLIIYFSLGNRTYQYLKKLPYWLKIFSTNTNITQQIEPNQPALKYPDKVSESSEIRKIVWQGAIKIWQAYPIFGSGLETFGYSYYNFKPKTHNLTSEWDFLYNKAHNEFLNILACQGIVGLISYLALITTFLVWSFKELKKTGKKDKKTSFYLLPLLIGYISILITNFFGFSVVIMGILFYLIPGFSFSLTKSLKKEMFFNFKPKKETSLNSFFTDACLFTLALILFFTVLGIVRRWQGDYHYNKGVGFYKTDYLLPALTELEKAIQLNSQEALYTAQLAKTSAKLAVAYSDLEATESAEFSQQLANLAENSIQRTIDLNPIHINFWKNRAEVYLLLSYLKPEHKQTAIDSLIQVSKLAPTDAKILYNLGLFYLQEGKTDKTIAAFEQTINLKPNYTRVYIKLAELYQEANQEEKAKERLEFILENIDPNHQQAKEILEELN